MTDPIQMARECGATVVDYSLPPDSVAADVSLIMSGAQLRQYTARVRAEALEECAGMLKIKACLYAGQVPASGYADLLVEAAEAIRALIPEGGK